MIFVAVVLLLFAAVWCFQDHSSVGRALVGVLLVLMAFGLLLADYATRNSDCDARGGVYLYRERKCVSGIEEVP